MTLFKPPAVEPPVVLIEVSGKYPGRASSNPVVFVGPDDPGAASKNGDVWIQTK